jgi:hypothetical protein
VTETYARAKSTSLAGDISSYYIDKMMFILINIMFKELNILILGDIREIM